MSLGSFDISFCHGKAEMEKDGAKVVIDCPVKNKCHRFWTEEHTKEALRTNDIYHSFIMPNAENISKDGCDYFLGERINGDFWMFEEKGRYEYAE